MRISINNLRRVIRKVLIESIDEEDVDLPYEETLMPDDEGKGVIGAVDFSEQSKRNDYLEKKASDKVKKKKDKLQSREETEADVSDEHAIVGAMGPAWGQQSGNGPGEKPYKQKILKPKNAMIAKSVKEALNSIK